MKTPDFSKWPKRRFGAWLAGFFDGEGSIYVPQYGVEISVSNTERKIIVAIQKHTGVGRLIETRFDRENWKTKYTWRVRRYEEVEPVLKLMLPFLTIKKDKAKIALARIGAKNEETRKRLRRNARIVRLRDKGLRHFEIAAKMKIERSTVTQVLRWIRTHGNVPWKRDRKLWIACNQTHRKTKAVGVRTVTRTLKKAA